MDRYVIGAAYIVGAVVLTAVCAIVFLGKGADSWQAASAIATFLAAVIALGFGLSENSQRGKEREKLEEIYSYAFVSDLAAIWSALVALAAVFRDQAGKPDGSPISAADKDYVFETSRQLAALSLNAHLPALVHFDAESSKAMALISGLAPDLKYKTERLFSQPVMNENVRRFCGTLAGNVARMQDTMRAIRSFREVVKNHDALSEPSAANSVQKP